MKINDLDFIQNELISDKPDTDKNCQNCEHADFDCNGLMCFHPLNELLEDKRIPYGVPSLVMTYLQANNLDEWNLPDSQIGAYCKGHQYRKDNNEDTEYYEDYWDKEDN